MNEVFEFTSEEVSKILYEEILRRGKKLPDRCGVQTFFHFIKGKVDYIQLKITDPIPGAKDCNVYI